MAGKKSKKRIFIGLKHVVMFVALMLVASTIFLGIQQKESRLVSDINIEIQSLEDSKPLINAEDVYEIIQKYTGFDIDRAALKNYAPDEIEALLNKDKRIKVANVYFGKDNQMYIEIEQRDPMVRVDVTDGSDFYLDSEGAAIPVYGSNILRLPVVTGNLDAYIEDYLEQPQHNLNEVYQVALKISNDEILRPLIEQIHIDEKSEIVLVPKLGRNRILVGTSLGLDIKLDKLKLYYKEGVKRLGLDRFEEINLRYDGQIVGIE